MRVRMLAVLAYLHSAGSMVFRSSRADTVTLDQNSRVYCGIVAHGGMVIDIGLVRLQPLFRA